MLQNYELLLKYYGQIFVKGHTVSRHDENPYQK